MTFVFINNLRSMVYIDSDKTIGITPELLEHIVNCLDNQKFLPVPDKKSSFEKVEFQDIIDSTNQQLREILNEALKK